MFLLVRIIFISIKAIIIGRCLGLIVELWSVTCQPCCTDATLVCWFQLNLFTMNSNTFVCATDRRRARVSEATTRHTRTSRCVQTAPWLPRTAHSARFLWAPILRRTLRTNLRLPPTFQSTPVIRGGARSSAPPRRLKPSSTRSRRPEFFSPVCFLWIKNNGRHDDFVMTSCVVPLVDLCIMYCCEIYVCIFCAYMSCAVSFVDAGFNLWLCYNQISL